MSIPGLPESAIEAILKTIGAQPQVQRVVLYGSRALGRQRSGSDVDLCLFAPAMTLAELLQLGAQLDDLLLPWRIGLQLDHLISHDGLRAHIQRGGVCCWTGPRTTCSRHNSRATFTRPLAPSAAAATPLPESRAGISQLVVRDFGLPDEKRPF